MTKQEEIREGINWLVSHAQPEEGQSIGDILMTYLDSKNVVIRVGELPCPRCKGSGEVRKWQEQYVGEGYWVGIICPKCKCTGKSGYVAVELLIAEKCPS